jgi:hypothetical protein
VRGWFGTRLIRYAAKAEHGRGDPVRAVAVSSYPELDFSSSSLTSSIASCLS